MKIKSVALVWGFSEATVFFIVPDVWLTVVGRDRLKRGLIACLYSLGGALAGGVVVYFWARYYPASALSVMDMIPSISTEMIARVRNDLAVYGVTATLFGPLTGTPYKLYAAQAYAEGVSLWGFILISIPARLIVFTWVIFYLFYFVII